MSINWLPLILLLSFSILVAIYFCLAAYRARKTLPGGISVMLVGVGVIIWSLGYGLELVTASLNAKIFWANFKQIGILLLPTATLLFALRYTQVIKSIHRLLVAILVIEPLAVLYLYIMDTRYQFMRINPALLPLDGVSILDFQFGSGIYLQFAYGAALIVASAILLLVRFFRSKSFYSFQIAYILIALLFPFGGAVLTMLGLLPKMLDVTPLFLSVCFPIMVFGLVRHHFFKLAPVNINAIMDHLPYAILVLNIDGAEKIIAMNHAAEKILGAGQSKALGKPVKKYIPNWNFVPGPEKSSEDFQLIWQGRYFNVNCFRTNMDEVFSANWLAVFYDLTERQEYEKELLEARRMAELRSQEAQEALRREQQLHAITRTISNSMELDTILSDLLRQTLEITDSQETHLGLLTEDGLNIHFQYGMNLQESYLLDVKIPRDLDYLSWQIVDRRKGIIIQSAEIDQLEKWFTTQSRVEGASSFMGVPVMSGLTVLGVLGVFSKNPKREFNAFDLAMMESIGTQAGIAIQNAYLFAEVNQLAVTDPLTRLYNRRYFFNLARVELERARRYGHDLSIIMLDIDLFKRVNDTFGHLGGDEVLVQVSETIRKNLRQVDLAARYGGEEMVVLLPETDISSARKTAMRLCKAICDLRVPFNGQEISVTVSVGVSSFDKQNFIDVSKMLDQADQAMYFAKDSGRNRVAAWPEIKSSPRGK